MTIKSIIFINKSNIWLGRNAEPGPCEEPAGDTKRPIQPEDNASRNGTEGFPPLEEWPALYKRLVF